MLTYARLKVIQQTCPNSCSVRFYRSVLHANKPMFSWQTAETAKIQKQNVNKNSTNKKSKTLNNKDLAFVFIR